MSAVFVRPARALEMDPAVAAILGHGWSVDVLLRVLELTGAVALYAHGGYMLFIPYGDGAWEAHYAMPGPIRGQAALRSARACLRAMFTRHKAGVIFGRTPRDNRAARLMNRLLGARPVAECTFMDGRRYVLYQLGRSQWATFSAAQSAR